MLRAIPLAGVLAALVFAAPAHAVTAKEKMETCKFGADDQKLAGALMWGLVMTVDSFWMMWVAADWFASEEGAAIVTAVNEVRGTSDADAPWWAGDLAVPGLEERSAAVDSFLARSCTALECSPEARSVWLAPSIAIFFTVLALNYVGDLVRRLFDVRESVL